MKHRILVVFFPLVIAHFRIRLWRHLCCGQRLKLKWVCYHQQQLSQLGHNSKCTIQSSLIVNLWGYAGLLLASLEISVSTQNGQSQGLSLGRRTTNCSHGRSEKKKARGEITGQVRVKRKVRNELGIGLVYASHCTYFRLKILFTELLNCVNQ